MPIDAIMTAEAPPAVACRPPPGFQDTPHPPIASPDKLVARIEQVEIIRPLGHVVDVLDAIPLEQMIEQGGDLPTVVGTHGLTPGAFDAPGSRRMACLSDGSTLVEQILEKSRTPEGYRFRYVVWNYTTRAARPIRYGLGEFVYTPTGPDRTHIRWTYAFELRRDRFPGALGPVGDWLLKTAFLDRSYARMMQGTLARMKAYAER